MEPIHWKIRHVLHASIFLYVMGGCPIQRIENVFEKKKNCCCTFYKGYMEEFLKIHLKLLKLGFENK